MPEEMNSQSGGLNINGVNGSLTIGGDAVGRDRVVSNNVTIQQFVAGVLSLDSQLEYFGREIGLSNIRAARYTNSQYEAYCDTWKSLQALRLAGDDLWEKANSENLLRFAERLRQATAVAREGEIFFEDKDRDNLLEVLRRFGNFHIGKTRLIAIRTKQQIAEYDYEESLEEEIGEQMVRNHEYKMQYEQLLEQIRSSFHRRLSNL